jgi:adenosylmethionine-8-amino-7-oxononanoate aminotransferase
MCGIEFVRDQETKLPFDPSLKVSLRFQDEAMRRGLILFHCTGCVEGVAGDMMLVTPPLVTTRAQVDEIMEILLQTTAAVEKEVL